ncbi:MAG: hypothetical protein RMZ43_018440 [Nostoc sp. CmiVER01]|uniref:hypothetical protein n=1 Tax=Nostoc sp. CmiVER01 TaxID=3075384 RepID=UPI003D161FC0
MIRGCGGVGGDLPTQQPKHDFTCTDSSELIQFTPVFGQTTEPGDGAEAVLDKSGQVIEFRQQRGGQIPSSGSVLSATGNAVEWLRNYAQLGSKIDINTRVLANGWDVSRRDESLGVINGGPRLLRNGKIDITAFREGFHWPENPASNNLLTIRLILLESDQLLTLLLSWIKSIIPGIKQLVLTLYP